MDVLTLLLLVMAGYGAPRLWPTAILVVIGAAGAMAAFKLAYIISRGETVSFASIMVLFLIQIIAFGAVYFAAYGLRCWQRRRYSKRRGFGRDRG